MGLAQVHSSRSEGETMVQCGYIVKLGDQKECTDREDGVRALSSSTSIIESHDPSNVNQSTVFRIYGTGKQR